MHVQHLPTPLALTLLLCFFTCAPPHNTTISSHNEKHELKVNFELKSDAVWQAPAQGQQTEVKVVLEITNQENAPMRFPIMDAFRISMLSTDGTEFTMEGGQDVVIPGKPVSDPVPPGGKYLLDLQGQLDWSTDDQLELILKDGLGSIWRIGPLTTGTYMLYMTYENQSTESKTSPDVWYGKAEITSLPVQIIH